MSRPPSPKITVLGRTKSGKSTLLRRRWLSKVPRLLIIDRVGDWPEFYPAADRVHGLPQTLQALQRRAPFPTWVIIANLQKEEVEELTRRLLPEGDLVGCYSRKIGGMAILIDEVDTVLTARSGDSSPVRGLWQRGSHAGLTVFAATQEPGGLHKIASSQADVVVIFALTEPAARDYVRSLIGREQEAEVFKWNVTDGVRHRWAYYTPENGEVFTCDPEAP